MGLHAWLRGCVDGAFSPLVTWALAFLQARPGCRRREALPADCVLQHRQPAAAGPEAHHLFPPGARAVRVPATAGGSGAWSLAPSWLVAADPFAALQVTARAFPADAVARARAYLAEVGSVGAYSHSQGIELVRKEVAAFIERRDGHQSDPQHIFLTDGASPGVQLWLRLLLRDHVDGVMIPIPQYPLYSACIPLYGGSQVNYFLEEHTGWSLALGELKASYDGAVAKGIKPRALVVINPGAILLQHHCVAQPWSGNPTGQCLEAGNIADIVRFCVERNMVIMADEVYQENVYVASKPFVSFKRVLTELSQKDPEVDVCVCVCTFQQPCLLQRFKNAELVSFHSTSKGSILSPVALFARTLSHWVRPKA